MREGFFREWAAQIVRATFFPLLVPFEQPAVEDPTFQLQGPAETTPERWRRVAKEIVDGTYVNEFEAASVSSGGHAVGDDDCGDGCGLAPCRAYRDASGQDWDEWDRVMEGMEAAAGD